MSLNNFRISIGILILSICGPMVLGPFADAAEVASDNLIGFWKLDETSGTSAGDSSSGSGNTGALKSGLAFSGNSVAGKVGAALSFDGITNYIALGNVTSMNFSGTKPYTISAWVKPPAAESGVILSNFNQGVAGQYFLALSAGRIYMRRDGVSPSDLFGATTMAAGAWNHVVGTYDGNNMSLYLNGISDATGPAATGILGDFVGSICIGTYLNNGTPITSAMDGSVILQAALDEVRVYNRALTALEVSQLHASATTAAPDITSSTVATGVVGQAFSYQITASGSPSSFNFTGLPAGLTGNATTGLISGTPSAVGTSTISIEATNAAGSGSAKLTLTVDISVASGNLIGHWKFDETSGNVVSDSSSVSGNTGTLRNGLAFSGCSVAGKIDKALNFDGADDFVALGNVTAMNFSGNKPYTLSAWVLPPAAESGVILSNFNQGVAGQYYLALSAGKVWMMRGAAPWNLFGATTLTPGEWSHVVGTYDGNNMSVYLNGVSDATPVASGPNNDLSVDSVLIGTYFSGGNAVTSATDSSVILNGALDEVRVYNASLTAEEVSQLYASATLMAPTITSAATATGIAGQSFSYQITASSSPTSYSATGLPSGLSGNTTTGIISGTPTEAGNSTVTIKASNVVGFDTVTLTISISASPSITSSTAASGSVGQPFSYQITASNSPTSYSASGLPTGLSVNAATGVISGTPTVAGSNAVTLGATNAAGSGSATLTITTVIAAPSITSAPTAAGTVGQSFSYQIAASNSPTSYSATGLPVGLSVNAATGVISGTPTASGSSPVTIGATNATGTGSATLSISIGAALAAPSMTSATTAAGVTGKSFSFQITASNNPTSFSATNLPPGLSVNTTTGIISGAPTAVGTSTVTIGATNAAGTGSSVVTISVKANTPPSVQISGSTPWPVVGQPYTVTVTVADPDAGDQPIPVLIVNNAQVNLQGGNGVFTYTLTPESEAGLSVEARWSDGTDTGSTIKSLAPTFSVAGPAVSAGLPAALAQEVNSLRPGISAKDGAKVLHDIVTTLDGIAMWRALGNFAATVSIGGIATFDDALTHGAIKTQNVTAGGTHIQVEESNGFKCSFTGVPIGHTLLVTLVPATIATMRQKTTAAEMGCVGSLIGLSLIKDGGQEIYSGFNIGMRIHDQAGKGADPKLYRLDPDGSLVSTSTALVADNGDLVASIQQILFVPTVFAMKKPAGPTTGGVSTEGVRGAEASGGGGGCLLREHGHP